MTKKSIENDQKLTVQQRATDSGSGHIFNSWFNRSIGDNDIVISPWWSEQRDHDLLIFAYFLGNDILQSAIASFTKKFKSMEWGITGPVRVAKRYQTLLSESNFGNGWGNLIGKTVQTYSMSDKGAFWELIGDGDPMGPIVGPVQGVAYLDNQYCLLTRDIEYPIIYYNSTQESHHKLHRSRVIHFVDSPSPNDLMNDTGFCAVSRVIASSEIMLKLAKYKKERLDDLPEAGLLMFNNVLPDRWENTIAESETDRKQKGSKYWKNILTFFGLDPAQAADAKFINFSKLPEQFDEFKQTEIYLNLLALSFGIDVREFWPKPIGGLGTGTEVSIQHEKSANKGIGEVLSMIERAINWKILPESCEFAFDFIDDTQDLKAATINHEKIKALMRLYDVDAGRAPVVSAEEMRQMLADNVSWFHEEFLENDITVEDDLFRDDDPKPVEPLDATEIDKPEDVPIPLEDTLQSELGERGYIDSEGYIYKHRPRSRKLARQRYPTYASFNEKYNLTSS